MLKLKSGFLSAMLVVIMLSPTIAQVNVDVNLNVQHILGEESTFKREKFINFHSDVTTNYWYDDDLFTDDLINEFINGYDVYMGRNTGTISWAANSVKEDPNRPGFCDLEDLETLGNANKDKYAENTQWHSYESRNNLTVCSQLWPMYPDGEVATGKGWYFSDTDTEAEPWGTASGEFFAHFLKDYFGEGGTTGQPKPELIEVVNEPLWELYEDIDRAFKYHKTVAKEVHKVNPEMKISGFCTAFPNLEEDNFQRWENRWMKFMDIAGEEMDIWSLHLYDAPSIDAGTQKKLRRGSNVEATLDMIEHYSTLKFGKAKPFIISEFGASSHDYSGGYDAYLDYLQNVSCNALTMQFMERSNNIVQAMNYTMLKASWGTNDVNDVWSARLLRQENEPESLTGKWIYTDRVQYYQLWSNVKGKRIDSKAHSLDLLTDAFVDGNKAYVILNNLGEEDIDVALNIFETSNLAVDNLMIKHFHLDDSHAQYDENRGVIDIIEYADEMPRTIELGQSGTMVLEYTFESDVPLDKSSTEVKYYSTDYYKTIAANSILPFQINNVITPESGEAVLRLGLGREHGKTLRPNVLVNGTKVHVPADFRGDNQEDRDVYFGVIEIDVPVELLKSNNTVEITFPDDGGHVSSLAMQVFDFNGAVERTGQGAVTGISVSPETKWLPLGGSTQLSEVVYPTLATNKEVQWRSSNEEMATVTQTGMVQAKDIEGEVTIYATTVEGDFTDECVLSIEKVLQGSITADDKEKYKNTTYYTNSHIEVIVDYFAGSNETVTRHNGGVQVLLRHMSSDWKVIKDYPFSDETTIDTNSGTAHVIVELDGLTPTDKLENGDFYFLLPKFTSTNGESYSYNGLTGIKIEEIITGSIAVDDIDQYKSTTYYTHEEMEMDIEYYAGPDQTISDTNGGVHAVLSRVSSDGSVIEDLIFSDETTVGTERGSSHIIIDLSAITPSTALLNGEYYVLYSELTSTDGEQYTSSKVSNIVIEEMLTGTIAVDDKDKYKNTTYYTNDQIEVIIDYFAGANETVTNTNGGVQVLLRRMSSGWAVIEDYMFSDAATIGTESGTAHVMIDLDEVTPTSELENGEFYFLFPKFTSSNGESYSVNGLTNIKIERDIASAKKEYELDFKVYPNPAKDVLFIEKGSEKPSIVSIYNMLGEKIFMQEVLEVKTSINIGHLPTGNYIVKMNDSDSAGQVILQKR